MLLAFKDAVKQCPKLLALVFHLMLRVEKKTELCHL